MMTGLRRMLAKAKYFPYTLVRACSKWVALRSALPCLRTTSSIVGFTSKTPVGRAPRGIASHLNHKY
jgi:hypothetical protein